MNRFLMSLGLCNFKENFPNVPKRLANSILQGEGRIKEMQWMNERIKRGTARRVKRKLTSCAYTSNREELERRKYNALALMVAHLFTDPSLCTKCLSNEVQIAWTLCIQQIFIKACLINQKSFMKSKFIDMPYRALDFDLWIVVLCPCMLH